MTLCSPPSAEALDPGRGVAEYVHDAWEVADGLPQSSVLAIAQTPDGYLWLGTEEGLVRFDGVSFTVFDRSNTEGLEHNYVAALLADRDGDLWIGTHGGLSRLSRGRFTAYGKAQGLSSEQIWSLCQGRDGSLWIGTAGGLHHLEGGRLTRSTVGDLASQWIRVIHEDSQGRVWVGTWGGGLKLLEDGRFVAYTTRDGLVDDRILSIGEDREGNLWVGTYAGLNMLREGRLSVPAAGPLTAGAVLADRDGSIWLGTRGIPRTGLARFTGGTRGVDTTTRALSDQIVLSIFEDREASLWIGTMSGLHRFKDGPVAVYPVAEGRPDDLATVILEDRAGAVWVGTKRGLGRLGGEGFVEYTSLPGLSSSYVLSLAEDRDGSLLIGTSRGGPYRLRDGTLDEHEAVRDVGTAAVVALAVGPEGTLWIGTFGAGLYGFKDGTMTPYGATEGLSNETVQAILVRRDGSVWIATRGRGLFALANGKLRAYSRGAGLASNLVNSLMEDRDGTLWIGTDRGLTRLREGRFAVYTRSDGLFDDTAFCILDDDRGSLWMSSNKGIYRVSKDQLEEHARGARSAVTSASYGIADGMKSRECNGSLQPACQKTRDGRLWFPTMKGVAVVDPRKLRRNPLPPPVVVERFAADGVDVALDADARLPPGTKSLELRYTGLSLVAPEKVRFKHRLEGFDTDWVDAGTRRAAYYTNLGPGRYRFRVIASNNDGVWNEQGADVPFRIEPSFYQTSWFYAACLLVLATAGFGTHRLRLHAAMAERDRVARDIHEERNRISHEFHDILAQGFTGIFIQLEVVRRLLEMGGPGAGGHLARAQKLAEDCLEEARQAVWTLRSRAESDATPFEERLRELASRQLVDSGIALVFEAGPEQLSLPPEKAHQVYRIVQEALTNMARHSRAANAGVHMTTQGQTLTVVIEDDGRGSAVAAAADGGFGLRGMRERAERIGATLALRSEPDHGTRIELSVPVGERPGPQ